MAKQYTKKTWIDEVLSGAARYNILEDGGGAFKSMMQIALATSVSQAGSTFNAAAMQNIENMVDDIDSYLYAIATEKTISSDTLTVDAKRHKVQPQSGTSDDLSTISGMVADTFVILYPSDQGTDTITIKHNVGNIYCLGGVDITLSYGFVIAYYNGTKVLVLGASGGSSGSNSVCDGRISLSSTLPVTTADTTGTALYFVPYVGNKIALYNGSTWNVRTFTGAGCTVNAPATTNRPFDVFCYDNSGTPTLEALSWTNDTTRATALVYQDGVLSKSGATTRRYLGTCRTNGTSGTVSDTRAQRFIWNYYNRKRKSIIRTTSDVSWTYATNAWRQANANSANLVEVVVGVVEDEIALRLVTSCTSSGSAAGSAGISEDVTNAPHADSHQQGGGASSSGWYPFCSTLDCFPNGVGYHYYAWIEFASAATITFYGGTSYYIGGLSGHWNC